MKTSVSKAETRNKFRRRKDSEESDEDMRGKFWKLNEYKDTLSSTVTMRTRVLRGNILIEYKYINLFTCVQLMFKK